MTAAILAAACLVPAGGAGAGALRPGGDPRAGALKAAGILLPSGSGEALMGEAVDGGTVFAGAPGTTVTAAGQGAVFAYTKTASGWQHAQRAVLVDSDPIPGDEQGTSVAAGDGIAVSGGDYAGPSRMLVFTRPRHGWSGTVTQAATLTASDGAELSDPHVAPGMIVAVGQRGDTSLAVYVFTRPRGGWHGPLHEAARLVPPQSLLHNSGVSLAIAGSVIAVGVPGENAIDVFTEPAGGWRGTPPPTARLTTTDGDSVTDTRGDSIARNFGASVAIDGSTILAEDAPAAAAHGSAYVFTEPAGGWRDATQTATLTSADAFIGPGLDASAAKIAISGGTVAIPAAQGGSGAVLLVYDEPAGGWSGTETQSAALIATQPLGAGIGAPVITPGTILTGGNAPYQENAAAAGVLVLAGPEAVYREPAGGWHGIIAPATTLTPSRTGAGTADVFTAAASGWAGASRAGVLAPPGQIGTVTFGDVAAWGDTVLATGGGFGITYPGNADPQGAYLFARPASGWRTEGQRALLLDGAGAALTDPALSGRVALAATVPASSGAPHNRIDLFARPAGGWRGGLRPRATLTARDGASLGAAVIDGRVVIALGAAGRRQALYVFAEPAGGWRGSVSERRRIALPQAGASQTASTGLTPAAQGTLTLSGHAIAVGGAISASAVAAPGTAYAVSEPARGWATGVPRVAVLRPGASIHDEYVYTEPRHGWRGTIRPAASLPLGAGNASNAVFAGSSIAAAGLSCEPSVEGGPCGGPVRLFARPPGGWHGTVTGTASRVTVSVPDIVPVGLAFSGGSLLVGDSASSLSPDGLALAVLRS